MSGSWGEIRKEVRMGSGRWYRASKGEDEEGEEASWIFGVTGSELENRAWVVVCGVEVR